MNQLWGSSSSSFPPPPLPTEAVGLSSAAGSRRGRGGTLPLQEELMDVLAVPLQPGCVQQDVLAALLDGALRGWRWVALEESLHTKHSAAHQGPMAAGVGGGGRLCLKPPPELLSLYGER